MNIKQLFKPKYVLSLGLLLMIAVAATAWMCCGVEWFDDMQYRRMPGEGIDFWHSEGPLITTFSEACEAVPSHFTVGSTRLPNLIQVFFNLVPPVAVDVLHGLMIAVFVFMVVVVAGGKTGLRSLGFVGTTALAMWVLLPWYDHMLSSVCQLNYVWVSVVCLLFIRLFHSDDILSPRWKSLQWLVAIVAGMMHEGFTFPIIAGALLVMAVEKHDRRRRAIMTLLMSIGAIAFFLTPGMLDRLETQVGQQSLLHFRGAVIVSALQLMSVYLLLGVTIFTMWKRGRHYVLSSFRQNLMYIAIMVVGYAIAIASGMVRRGLWFVELASIILTLKMLIDAYGWWRRPNIVLGSVAGLATVASILGVAVWQNKFSEEVREVCRQVEASGRPVAFVDLENPGNAPWWTFNVAQSISSHEGSNAYCRSFGYADYECILVLPSRFKNMPVSQWDKVLGNANVMGQFPYYVATSPTGGCLQVTLGQHQSAASPLDKVMSKMSTDDIDRSMVPAHYWTVTLESGDMLYCHNINIYGHSKRHRKILSIDKHE